MTAPGDAVGEPAGDAGGVAGVSGLVVRRANSADVTPLARIQAAASTEGYAGLFPPEAPPPPAPDLAEVWRRTLPAATVLVATIDGDVVGGVAAWVDTGVLSQLYVDPGRWGAGVGGALHDAALAELRAVGCTHARLWVLKGNQRARRMYERRGWTLVEGECLQPDWPGVVEVVYELALGR